MKKVYVFTLLCLVLLLLVPGIVSAATPVETTDQTEASGTTTVTYGTVSKFQLTIPPSFQIDYGVKEYEYVSVSNARLPENTFVNVSVSSPNYDRNAGTDSAAWNLKLVNGNELIPYHLHSVDKDTSGSTITYINSKKVANETTFLSAPSSSFVEGVGLVECYLEFRLSGTSGNHAGTYTDTLTFTAKIYHADGRLYNGRT